MKKIKFTFIKKIQEIFVKYNITFSYYVFSIAFLLFFTFLLIWLIGNSVLKHEDAVLKTEFIKKNRNYTLINAEKIKKYREDLDTLSIVDLINIMAKKDYVVYAYVLNQDGEVISHTVQSEIFKKYSDKFVNKKYLNYFVNNIKKVWHEEKQFKGKNIIKFSKPIILQFTKKEILDELKHSSYDDEDRLSESLDSDEMLSSLSNIEKKLKENVKNEDEFIITASLHIAFSTEQLEFVSKSSREQVRIYYFISYMLAVVFGLMIGKYAEKSFKKANLTLQSVLKEVRTDEINMGFRVDTFKSLFKTVNQFVLKYKDITDKSDQDVKEIDRDYDLLISKLCDNIDDGVIITNNHLKVDFINQTALTYLNKKQAVKENINEVLDEYLDVVDNINKAVSKGKDESYSIQSRKKTFYLIPLFLDKVLKRFIIIISSEGKIKTKKTIMEKVKSIKEDKEVKKKEKPEEKPEEGKKEKEKPEEKQEENKEEKPKEKKEEEKEEKKEETEEDIKNKISSRLKNI